MGAIGGSGGTVNGMTAVREWSIDTKADVQPYVASNTKAMTGRVLGNVDWSGKFSAYGFQPVVMPGQVFTFSGNMSNGNGAEGTAIVDSVSLKIDIEGGKPIGYDVSFSSMGALTFGETVATDVSIACAPPSIGCKVEVAPAAETYGTEEYVEVTDVKSVDLNFTAANVAYNSSATAGQTARVVGNVDCTCSIAVTLDDLTDLPVKNDIDGVKVWVSATEFWVLRWMICSGISGVTVPIESAGVVGATINYSFTGYAVIDGECTEGDITLPDTTEYWPGGAYTTTSGA